MQMQQNQNANFEGDTQAGMQQAKEKGKEKGRTQAHINQANSLFKPLSDFETREAQWLVPEYIPRGTLVTMGGDGGVGKTTIWSDLVAAISTGEKCFFDPVPPGSDARSPERVMFLSSEDSVEIVLKKRLEAAGANMANVYTASLQDERFKDLKFDSPILKETISQIRPALIVFDPIQGFIPDSVNMGARNDMRNLLSPLIGIGEQIGTTFLLIAHTNKRSGVYGRNRLADSADLWDISRSVLIVGKTPDDSRYISHEKSNYGRQGQTIVFDIEDDLPVFLGHSNLRDRDYVRMNDSESRQAPQRSEAERFIIEFLKKGKRQTSELDEAAASCGISRSSLARAKAELKNRGAIAFKNEGYGSTKKWFIYLTE